ncbi:MAG: HD domain-containing phosphohydrolase [Cyanobacteriota bacterium]|nr:HD domain-containing phosphohydrolase [Cyanobacteriota bacterium]
MVPPLLGQQISQLQQLGERAHGLVPHLERLLCFVEAGPGLFQLLFDSQAAALGDPPAPALWGDPLQELQHGGPRALYTQTLADHRIVCVAEPGTAFAPAEQATLAVLAELIIANLRSAGDALEALRQATGVAHDFARLRDSETGNHLERVSRITRLIAIGLAESHQLSATFIEHLSLFSRLHDIGKIGIPDGILLKPGRLTAEEMVVMRTHVELGLEILKKLLGQHSIPEQPATRLMANLIRTHHERLDGSGYPAGLRGEEIPLEGRILAVADVFDAVTSTRPYRLSASVAEGLKMVRDLADKGELDPACVAALEAEREELEAVVADYRDPPVAAL